MNENIKFRGTLNYRKSGGYRAIGMNVTYNPVYELSFGTDDIQISGPTSVALGYDEIDEISKWVGGISIRHHNPEVPQLLNWNGDDEESIITAFASHGVKATRNEPLKRFLASLKKRLGPQGDSR
jgi:hypothetical protein